MNRRPLSLSQRQNNDLCDDGRHADAVLLEVRARFALGDEMHRHMKRQNRVVSNEAVGRGAKSGGEAKGALGVAGAVALRVKDLLHFGREGRKLGAVTVEQKEAAAEGLVVVLHPFHSRSAARTLALLPLGGIPFHRMKERGAKLKRLVASIAEGHRRIAGVDCALESVVQQVHNFGSLGLRRGRERQGCRIIRRGGAGRQRGTHRKQMRDALDADLIFERSAPQDLSSLGKGGDGALDDRRSSAAIFDSSRKRSALMARAPKSNGSRWRISVCAQTGRVIQESLEKLSQAASMKGTAARGQNVGSCLAFCCLLSSRLGVLYFACFKTKKECTEGTAAFRIIVGTTVAIFLIFFTG